ncbi:MAG: hypothetical protein ACRDHS_03255 [Actinomycetota bacterium]
MRAELYRPDSSEDVLAVATWEAGKGHLEVADPSVSGLEAILRPTPIAVDDASLRRLGTHGPTVLEPGDLEWFRAALLTRAADLGLAVRFVFGRREGGWDPAAQYRTFEEQVGRLSG